MKRYFTSESVTEGHPDKLCDQIADAILDKILSEDPAARVACECCTTTGMVVVIGEITTSCYIDIAKTVRETLNEIGYTKSEYGIDSESCGVLVAINEQSPDIAMGVNKALEARMGEMDDGMDTGAGDQGLMFGYACKETPTLMPLAITLAHQLAFRLGKVRKDNILPYLRPDGKTQVTVEYEDNVPKRLETILISAQHDPDIDMEALKSDIIREVILPVIPENLLDDKTNIYVNPTGRFAIGGPSGDSGLTGRKIIVDTYGGYAHHGGGSFSGKDPTKVDRSASYMARYIAKNIVAADIASECEVQIAYGIGMAKPISVFANSFNTGIIPDSQIAEIIKDEFDLRPAAIIQTLDLQRPIYKKVAAYGHFGREDAEVPWEKTDRVESIQSRLALVNN